MIKPNDYTQFKGIDGQRIKLGKTVRHIPVFPTVGAGELRGYRLEMGRGLDAYDNPFNLNESAGMGFEIPQGETWFPFYVRCSMGLYGGNTHNDNEFLGLRLSNWTLKWRGDNGWTNYEKDYFIANVDSTISTSTTPLVDYQRVDENVFNLTAGVDHRKQLYLGMWPEGVTIHHGFKAKGATGWDSGLDRVYIELLVHVVRHGEEYLEHLRNQRIADKEIIRNIMAESATMFPNVSIE